MLFEKSEKLFKEAKKYLVGGVNSPIRAFKQVGGNPIFISHAKGSKIYSVDGFEFIDYCASYGAIILGHAYEEVIEEIKKVCEKGTTFGAPTIYEIELSKMICSALEVELCRFVNSGTEALMSAIRIARAWTKRKKILKFEGCYHGHYDALILGEGTLDEVKSNTIFIPFNDFEALEKTFEKFGEEIACAVIEPIAGNMGVVLPEKNFLEKLRDLTIKYNSLLIFDEVITGFRFCFGGVQKLFNIKPDITCLGKIIGGGLPIGAYCGRKEIMELVSPEGPVYQAGTFSGNPISMVAGLKTLKILKENPKIYDELDKKGKILEENIKNLPITINRFGSMMTIFFKEGPVKNYNDVLKCDKEKFSKFFWKMVEKGIYIPPSQYEAWFITYAHSYEDIEKTIEAIKGSIK
jgi:glutamate-1-semialdehyde 2,1-aminomutase